MSFMDTNLSADGIKNNRVDTEEWDSGATRLGLDGPRERCHDDTAGLSLPEGIYNSALPICEPR